LNLLTDFPHKGGSILVSGKNRQTGSQLPHNFFTKESPLTYQRLWDMFCRFGLGMRLGERRVHRSPNY